jgi:Zn finger protein HypA/HybF involved in hydrogenase expression
MERPNVETLMVTCAQCRRDFTTPLQVDRATLEALVISNIYECPHCGAHAAYVKTDHFHRLEFGEGPPW